MLKNGAENRLSLLLILGWCLVAVLALALLFVIIGALRRQATEIRPLKLPETTAHVGTMLEYRFEIVCSWIKQPVRPLVFEPAAGLQFLEQPRVWRQGRISPGLWRWQVRFVLQPFAVADVAPGELTVEMASLLPQTPETPRFILPGIQVRPDQSLRRTSLERFTELPYIQPPSG